ncbi:MAG TPA: hypothetical protein ENI85_05240 [Deltaproteobacteria bacterium]|nr:hypothetical protein [Deltaproteobacteria bacterium]
MKIKFVALVSIAMLAFGFSLAANAGSVADNDGDLVPDVFDNCPNTPNGPGQNSNQVDTDADGFGNACDCDFVSPAPGDGFILGDDILAIFANFGTSSALHDLDGDGTVLGTDVLVCFSQFGGPPG